MRRNQTGTADQKSFWKRRVKLKISVVSINLLVGYRESLSLVGCVARGLSAGGLQL